MKTSLLYARHSDSCPRRAYLPKDGQEPPFHVARFVSAHETHSYPFDFDKMKIGKGQSKQIPDSVDLQSDIFHFKHGVTGKVKIISQEYIDRIDAIDKELKCLSEEQGRIIEEAWRRGTPLRKSDLTS